MENINQIDQFGDYAESLNSRPLKWDRVDVTVNPGNNMLKVFSNAFFDELDSSVGLSGGQLNFSRAELFAYNQFALVQRVLHVMPGKRPDIHPKDKNWCFHGVIHQLQTHLGIVIENTLGIEVHPTLPKDFKVMVDSETEFTLDMAQRVSRSLRVLSKDHGFVISMGYPIDSEGSWDTMSFFSLEDFMVRYNGKAHNSFALAGAFLDLKGLESVLSPRVEYGRLSVFENCARNLAQVKV